MDKENMSIEKILTEGIVFKPVPSQSSLRKTGVRTKARKKAYITGCHGSGSAKMKAGYRRRRANRHK